MLYLLVKLRRILFFLILASLACQTSSGINRSAAVITTVSPENWYSIYFTDPTNPKNDRLRDGPDRALAEAIRAARVSVDLAVLQFNLWSIRDALLNAHRRGVTVRLVVESDYRDSAELEALIEAGIPVLGDRREGSMHNKFVVIDRQEVWTGSMNFTITDGYRNNNNLVRIRSSQLAQNYTVEFEEMFVEDQFGPGSPTNTPNPSLTVEGVQIQVCFAPEDGCAAQVENLIRQAQHSIRFMVFSFTSDALADALIERAQAGVSVRGVVEASQARANSGAEYLRLLAAGVDVRLDGNPRNMHHKVIVIDDEIVIAGSYNYTFFAETRNDENLLVVQDPQFAAAFVDEFQRIYAQAAE
ncbi:MAG: phospholipase D-like domain-containing protein [Anaerolineales bacterium]|nr:phospholipase D-like domain-containing protein [Anaerolineales bacterium]